MMGRNRWCEEVKVEMELGLRERVAIVGGSSKGMGRAAALALAREGASVTVCARDEAELRKTEIEIARVGSQHHVLAIPADLSRPEDIKRVVRGTFNRFGRIDISVNSIGEQLVGRPAETEDGEWEEDLEQNFLSVVRMSREVVPYMKQQQWGRIINRLSMSANPQPGVHVISTSSHMALVGFTKILASELAPFNITVNNVLPGYILTDQAASVYEAQAQEREESPEDMIKQTAKTIPMGRLGKPEEVADLLTFLASERSSYITGVSIPLDGGARQVIL